MIHKTIYEMARLYTLMSSHAPNELRGHPETLQAICNQIARHDPTRIHVNFANGDVFFCDIFGDMKFVNDDKIPPGTFYLDRDGATLQRPHTGYQTFDFQFLRDGDDTREK
jgi:hypothetical protein